MKKYLIISLIFALLICSCASHDLTKDEGVLTAVNSHRERPVDIDQLCIQQFDELEEVILIGYFVDGIGCEFEDLFVGDEFGPIVDLTQAGLQRNGWADEMKREELALFWLQNVLFATRNSRVLLNESKAFAENNQIFHPPQTKLQNDGAVTVSYWSVVTWESAGQSFYSKQEIRFSDQGDFTKPKTLKKFTVTYDQ